MQIGVIEVYLLKSSIYLLVFYLFNKLLISRDTFHALGRVVWLVTAVASMVLPFCMVGFEPMVVAAQSEISAVSLPEIIKQTNLQEVGYSSIDILSTLCFVVYIIGVAVVLFLKLRDYLKLFRLVLPKTHRNYNPKYQELIDECEELMDIKRKVHYIFHDEALSPFSWMNYIVVSKSDIEQCGNREILLHELSHVKLRHSWDIVLMDLLTTVQWFNPSVWLAKRELQLLQEYQADSNVLDNGADLRTYQLLLIKKAIGKRHYTMSNSLNHSNLKNRITMMMKTPSKKWVMAKCLYTLPVAFIALSAYGSPSISRGVDEIADGKFTNFFAVEQILHENKPSDVLPIANEIMQEDTTVYMNCEVMPSPTFIKPDANVKDFAQWFADNIDYKGEVSGRTVAKFTVEKDGSISNAAIVRSIDKELDKKIIELLLSSAKWTPGTNKGKPIRFVLSFPIDFVAAATDNTTGYINVFQTIPDNKYIQDEARKAFGDNLEGVHIAIVSKTELQKDIVPKINEEMVSSVQVHRAEKVLTINLK